MKVIGPPPSEIRRSKGFKLPEPKSSAPLFLLIITYLVSVFVSSWINHQNRQWNGFGLDAEVNDAIDTWGASDPASYLTLGNEIFTTGAIPEGLWWIITLWAPGQAWIYLGSLRIGGESGFVLVLLLIDSLLWLLALLSIRSALKNLIGDTAICLALILYVIFSDFRGHALGPLILYSDGTAAAILIILAFKLRSYWNQKTLLETISNGLIIGFCMASVIYLRSQNRYLFHALVLLIMAGLFWTIFELYVQSKKSQYTASHLRLLRNSPRRKQIATNMLISTILSCVVIVVSFTPYLTWKGSTLGDVGWDFGGKYVLTSGDALVFPQNWLEEEQLASWQSEGGGGWACRINPDKCAEIHKIEKATDRPWNLYDVEPFSTSDFRRMSIETALTKPFQFGYDRSVFLYRYLFSDTALVTPNSSPSKLRAAHLVVTLLVFWRLARNARLKGVTSFGGVCVGLILLTFLSVVPPMFINFEVRYLLPLRTILNIFFYIGSVVAFHALFTKLRIRKFFPYR